MELVASIDEAGRGALLGRVYSAAVIWDNSISHKLLLDSKVLTPKRRDEMRLFVLDNCINYGIGYADVHEINSLNVLQATVLSMHRALSNLNLQVDRVEVDGNYFKPWNNVPYTCHIGGDKSHIGISAASILAKTSRDYNMLKLHAQYPNYFIDKHKGYGTSLHYQMLKTFGVTPQHRNFNLKL
jgi:ribonuclease HII